MINTFAPQEELKITNLLHSLLIEEEMMNTEEDLIYRQKKAVKVQFIWLVIFLLSVVQFIWVNKRVR